MSITKPKPTYRLLEAAERHLEQEGDKVDAAHDVLQTTLRHFPELSDRTITVGITHEEITWHGEPYAMADPYNDMIFIKADCLTEYQVWFHELMHILIRKEDRDGKDVPVTSEPYCSIRTVARMPPDMLYRDSIAYLGEPDAPKDEWPDICQRALDYREDHRNYIQKCKEWLEI